MLSKIESASLIKLRSKVSVCWVLAHIVEPTFHSVPGYAHDLLSAGLCSWASLRSNLCLDMHLYIYAYKIQLWLQDLRNVYICLQLNLILVSVRLRGVKIEPKHPYFGGFHSRYGVLLGLDFDLEPILSYCGGFCRRYVVLLGLVFSLEPNHEHSYLGRVSLWDNPIYKI